MKQLEYSSNNHLEHSSSQLVYNDVNRDHVENKFEKTENTILIITIDHDREILFLSRFESTTGIDWCFSAIFHSVTQVASLNRNTRNVRLKYRANNLARISIDLFSQNIPCTVARRSYEWTEIKVNLAPQFYDYDPLLLQVRFVFRLGSTSL